MATGDFSDLQQRLQSLLPPSWFDDLDGTPVLDTLLAGAAYPLAWDYVLYEYVLTQARLATMTGVWLDRFAFDFFGANKLLRRPGELDNDYRARIKTEIMRERQTRSAVTTALENLTGVTPQIMELWNPLDCGGYDQGVDGYDEAGAYGDLSKNNQFLVTAFRAPGGGVPNVGGYVEAQAVQKPRLIELPLMAFGIFGMVGQQEAIAPSFGGAYVANEILTLEPALAISGIWGMIYANACGALEYVDDQSNTVGAQDAEIYDTIASTVAAGMTAWTAIRSATEESNNSQFNFGNVANAQDLILTGSFF